MGEKSNPASYLKKTNKQNNTRIHARTGHDEMHVFDIVGVPAMDFWTDYEAGFVDLSCFLSTENHPFFPDMGAMP